MIRHQLNYQQDLKHVEFSNLPSETIPDQSLTVKQILQRFTTGTLPPISKETYYEEDPDIDDPDPMYAPNFDLVDYEEAKRKLERRIKYRRQANENALKDKTLQENKEVLKDKTLQENKEVLKDPSD